MQAWVDAGGSIVGRTAAANTAANTFGLLQATAVAGNNSGNGIVKTDTPAGSILEPYRQDYAFVYPAVSFTDLGEGTKAEQSYGEGNPLLAGHWRATNATNGPENAASKASVISGEKASGGKAVVFGTSVVFRNHPKGGLSQAARGLFWAAPAGTKVIAPPVVVDPEVPEVPKSPFTDVKPTDKFSKQINWLFEKGLSTGIKKTDAQGNVTYVFEPKSSMSREAMAAFLYRLEAPSDYQAPAKSPFSDVKPSDKFYKQIAWMYDAKISTGTKQAVGKPTFGAKTAVTREAMAAFLYRFNDPKGYKAPAKSPFSDMKSSDKFYKQIAWMSDSGISTGVKQPSGLPKYAPKDSTTREAMAAFIYRSVEG